MNRKHIHCLVAAVAAALFIPSCTSSGIGGLAAYHAYDRPAKLPKNPNHVSVKVSLSKQRAYVMEGSDCLLAMPISVGAPGSPTPKGNFRIFNKIEKKRANTHGYAHSGGSIRQTMLSKKPAGWSFKGTPMPY